MRLAQHVLMFPLKMVNGLPASKLQTYANSIMNDYEDSDDNGDSDKDSSHSKNRSTNISNVNDTHTSHLLL
jgi:hypothetical protein